MPDPAVRAAARRGHRGSEPRRPTHPRPRGAVFGVLSCGVRTPHGRQPVPTAVGRSSPPVRRGTGPGDGHPSPSCPGSPVDAEPPAGALESAGRGDSMRLCFSPMKHRPRSPGLRFSSQRKDTRRPHRAGKTGLCLTAAPTPCCRRLPRASPRPTRVPASHPRPRVPSTSPCSILARSPALPRVLPEAASRRGSNAQDVTLPASHGSGRTCRALLLSRLCGSVGSQVPSEGAPERPEPPPAWRAYRGAWGGSGGRIGQAQPPLSLAPRPSSEPAPPARRAARG